MRKRRTTQGELIAMKKYILEFCLSRKMKDKEGAKVLGLHPKSFSRLKHRYLKEGEAALIPKKPGPKRFTPPNRTPKEIVDKVERLAISYPDLGPQPLAWKLEEMYKIKLHSTTVWRILKRQKIRYGENYTRWKENPKLYCLDEPGQELQMDGCYPYGRAKKIVVLDAIDDCSRWAYARIYDRETAQNAIDFVKNLIVRAPFRIQRIRIDNRYGKDFISFCNSLGIEVIENEPYSPEQNGKIERFHRTLKRELFWRGCSFYDGKDLLQYKLNQWLNYYNTERRHGGFRMNRMTPCLKIASTLFNSLNFISYPQKVTLILQQYKF